MGKTLEFESEDPYVQSDIGSRPANLTVKELVLEDYSGWDENLVRDTFNPGEAARILATPIFPWRRDQLAWRHAKTGIYSVRTGYAESMRRMVNADVQMNADVEHRWKWVWAVDVMPKIKVFGWRLLHNILPSAINLISRFVDVDPLCVRCGTDIETTEHALRDCEWVRDFWRSSNMGNAVQVVDENESLHGWVIRVARGLAKEKQGLFITMLWWCIFIKNYLS